MIQSYNNNCNNNYKMLQSYDNNYNKNFCNNCGKFTHNFNKCKEPITSMGIIAFRHNLTNQKVEFLMIQRKDSLGFVDLVRGKYNIKNKQYIKKYY